MRDVSKENNREIVDEAVMSVERIPFIPDAHLEAEAERLLLEYGSCFSPVVEPPVPVEDILEKHLGLTLRLDDLRTAHRDPLILGAISLREGVVYVDSSLVPDDDPTQLGRYRFTLGHELGHWRIHRDYFLAESSQLDCVSEESRPDIVCRDGDTKDSKEFQADRFSAFLLMPKRLVLDVCRDIFPNGSDRKESEFFFADAVTILAERFSVSKSAMRIRLETLGRSRNTSQLFLI